VYRNAVLPGELYDLGQARLACPFGQQDLVDASRAGAERFQYGQNAVNHGLTADGSSISSLAALRS
jgi:hypothetical protein